MKIYLLNDVIKNTMKEIKVSIGKHSNVSKVFSKLIEGEKDYEMLLPSAVAR